MFRNLALGTLTALALASGGAMAAGTEPHVTNYSFSFEGPFGAFDQNQLQRGLQVYTEVCAACHGLRYVPIRTLSDEGGPALPEDQVRAYIEQNNIEVYDTDLQDWRAATPNDNFPMSALDTAPDLSLMTKARAGFFGPYGLALNPLVNGIGGPEYVASILTGYEDPPACAPDDFTGHYNRVFESGGYPDECLDHHGHRTVEGSWIAMAPPLWPEGEQMVYHDDAPTDMQSVALDVSAFLTWTAEPHMMARKKMGFTAVIVLSLLSVLLYLTNKRIWWPVKHREDADTPAE
ncbi:cytochrome c1 [Rhodophyticola sp. CCM32]|uniref:cytochrome c1 n=1 Tax=Rhodophyticola sp. CCM32 TaxID=2916397 RepID=UPI00107F15BD|nr:cytochrome c1 [Rhodophyticola sp. CCM32]QBY01887.1 cytochrome c1 [Rhodophyticola sp. CCM32]